MFANVKAFLFLFGGDAEAHDGFESAEDDEGGEEGSEGDGDVTDELDEEVAATKDTDGERAPGAADAVDGDRADGIVNLDFVEEEDGDDDEDACDDTGEDGGPGWDDVSTGGDADEASENAVEGHGEVRFFEEDPGGECCGDTASGAGEGCGDEGKGDADGLCAENGAAVEAEPAEEEEEDADSGEGHAMAEDGADFAVGEVFAIAWAEDENGCKCGVTAEGMDEGGAGKVSKAHLVEPAAAPFPGAGEGVNEAHKECGADHEGSELDALSHSTRDDGCRGGSEHGLENEISPVSVSGVVFASEVFDDVIGLGEVIGDGRAEREDFVDCPVFARIHGIEAVGGIHKHADADDEDVFEEDVGGVFGLREAALDASEAEVHEEDECGGNANPEVIDDEDGVISWFVLPEFFVRLKLFGS